VRILSVKSQNILLVKFIDLKIIKVSLRELFLIGAGAGLIADVLRGNPALLLFPVGILFLFLGLTPVKFIPLEVKFLHFLQYKSRNKKTIKRDISYNPESAGLGTIHEEVQDDTLGDTIDDSPQIVHIDNLDSPYTLTLHTKIKKQFIPVTIKINERIIANTVTNRHGDVSCTILIDEYGPKDVQVIANANDDGMNNSILYDRRIIFEN